MSTLAIASRRQVRFVVQVLHGLKRQNWQAEVK